MPGEVDDRYQRELAALAALHDPRLCTTAQTLPGESLEARVRREPLTTDAALELAIEIASALEAPHLLGILHRKLTLANVWLLPSGEVRLLNFNAGRALVAAAAGGGSRETTTTNEQPDPRADLYAFGGVLKALAGEHPAAGLRRVMRRCLEHNPDRRFQTATELREELERIRVNAPVRVRRPPWRLIAFAAIALLIGAVTWWKLASTPSGPLRIPELSFSQATYTANIAAAALSRDGRSLATVQRDPGGESLHLHSLAAGGERELVGDGAGCCSGVSISPDGNWVYFLAGGKLWSSPVSGDGMRLIASAAQSGAGFAPSGKAMAFIADGHLVVASLNGENARVLATGPFAAVTPAWSPDGQHLAAVSGKALQVVTVASGQIAALDAGRFAIISGLSWLPSGRGLLISAVTASRLPQQLWQLAWPGGGQLSALTTSDQGYTQLSAGGKGPFAVLHAAPEASLWVQSSAGGAFTALPIGGLTRDGRNGVAWLPGGAILTTHVFHHDHQLWVMSADGKQAGPVTVKGVAGELLAPIVTGSGQVVFLARTGGAARVWRANADGSGAVALSAACRDWAGLGLIRNGSQVEFLNGDHLVTVPISGGTPRLLWKHPVGSITNAASPDGKQILVFAPTPTLLTLAGDGTVAATPVALNPVTMLPPYGFTPDGHALTYVVRQPGGDNVWALPLDGTPAHALTHFGGQQIFAYAFDRAGRLVVSRGRENSNAYVVGGLGGKN